MAATTSYTLEKSKMIRARNKFQIQRSNSVKTLRDFVKFLASPAGKNSLKRSNLDGVELSHTTVTDKNGFPHVILRNDKLLEELVDGLVGHLDGTFGSRPNFADCSQLVTLLVKKFDKVYELN